MVKWAKKINSTKYLSLFSENSNSNENDAQIKLNTMNLDKYKNIHNPSSLTHIDQILLAPYHTLRDIPFIYKFGNLDKHLEKVLQMATHFHNVQGIYHRDELIEIQMREAKTLSLAEFKSHIELGKINSYVESMYLTPNPKIPADSLKRILYSNIDREFYIIDKNYLSINDISDQKKNTSEIVNYFRDFHPNFYITTPFNLVFDSQILSHYAFYLLSTIYNTIFCCIEKDTNVIIYLGGSNNLIQ